MGSQLVLCGQYFWHQGFFLKNNLYWAANLSNPVNSQLNWIYTATLKDFKYYLYRKNKRETLYYNEIYINLI